MLHIIVVGDSNTGYLSKGYNLKKKYMKKLNDKLLIKKNKNIKVHFIPGVGGSIKGIVKSESTLNLQKQLLDLLKKIKSKNVIIYFNLGINDITTIYLHKLSLQQISSTEDFYDKIINNYKKFLITLSKRYLVLVDTPGIQPIMYSYKIFMFYLITITIRRPNKHNFNLSLPQLKDYYNNFREKYEKFNKKIINMGKGNKNLIVFNNNEYYYILLKHYKLTSQYKFFDSHYRYVYHLLLFIHNINKILNYNKNSDDINLLLNDLSHYLQQNNENKRNKNNLIKELRKYLLNA